MSAHPPSHRVERSERSQRPHPPVRRERPLRRPSRVLAGLLSGLLALAGLSVATTVTAAPADAATSCGFATAGTGTYAKTLCWIDLTGYNAATAATGQTYTQSIPGGYTMTFTLTVTGSAARAVSLPTWSGAYLGNNGHYTGVPGAPALYQSASGTTTATLTNITVTDSTGTAVTGYSLVGADAEATSPGESITWTSSNPITSLTANSSGNGLGNACGGGFTGVGTTTVKCTGGNSGAMTGTAMLASSAPSSFSQSMLGGGLEGVAFGVLVSSVQLSKTVVNGYPGDAFGLSITSSDNSTLATANTNGSATATTGPTTVIVGAGGSNFTFAEAATAGSLANYTQNWTCTRNGATDATLPSGAAGSTASVTVGVGDAVDCAITNTAIPSSLSLLKKAGTPVDVNGDGIVDAGDTIAYSFDVSNTGQLAVDSLAVADAKAGTVTCPVTSLAPSASTTCTADAPYVITAADVTAGSVDNTANASAIPSGTSATISSGPSSTQTATTAPAPALSLTKSASPSGAAAYTAGQVVTYTFAVKNTGNVAVSGIALDDSAFTGTGTLGPVTCPVGADTLAVGAEAECTAAYTLTQADVDAGSVSNTATASGVPAGGGTVSSPGSTVTTTITPAPAIALVKSASPTTASAAGDVITYGFAVTNRGNVSLSAAAITETAFSGSGGTPSASCPQLTFVPGQTIDCTATYVLTQADVDAGTVSNTATASATAANGTDPVSASSTAAVTIAPGPALTVAKSSVVNGAGNAGDTVTYSFLVTNTGNVSLTGVSVTDSGFTGTGALSAVTCPTTALAPTESTTCTASYTLTQADVDAGHLSNTATATATPPGGGTPPVSPSSTDITPLSRTAALTVAKTAAPGTVTAAGALVTYSFVVTNTGNVTLTDPVVNESAFTGTGPIPVVVCPTGTSLAPTQSVTCEASYTVTQEDVDAGTIGNTATVTATPPSGVPIPLSPSSSATVTATPAPALSVLKAADVSTITAAGQEVTYSFLVTNTGNVTMSGIAIDEGTFTGTGALPAAVCPQPALAPGDHETCTTVYRVTQADVDHGTLSNSATATGTAPGASIPTPSDPSGVTVTADQKPGLSLVKSASVPAPTTFHAGENITYSFVITNTGNVTMSAVGVQEGTFTGTGTLPAPTCPAGAATLAPGAQVICTTVYTVTQADVDAGAISNTAAADGTAPGASVPLTSTPDSVTVPEPAAPAATVVKTADAQKVTQVGQVIHYTFTVTDTGNTSLTAPRINEGAFTGHGTVSTPVCPATPATLLPGQSIVCTASYTVVAADLTGAPLSNTATVTVTPPVGDPLTSGDSTARITDVVKAAAPGSGDAAGSLASTGSTIAWWIGGLALILVVAGAILLLILRRRTNE